MPVAPIAIPLCTNQVDKLQEPCGLPMFRVGTEAQWAWVCESCDRRDPKNSLDVVISPE